MYLWLGIPTAILSALVGTSVFAALNEQPGKAAQIAVGLVSILVAILASLQTFLRLAERAEKHKESAARFAALHREVDQALVLPPTTDQELKTWMDSFRERWDALAREAPTANRRIWERARGQMLQHRQQKGVKSFVEKGVKSFVGSYWLLLKPSLACLAPDEIQFAELFTMS
jgi:hypothetical protein